MLSGEVDDALQECRSAEEKAKKAITDVSYYCLQYDCFAWAEHVKIVSNFSDYNNKAQL